MPTLPLRLAIVFLLCLSLVSAQLPLRWTYVSGYTVTGTSAKLTVQLPTIATRVLHPLMADVVCPSGCVVTFIRNGTAATATAGTVVKNRTANPTAQAEVYTASNSTGGTSFPARPIPGGPSQTFDLSDMEFIAGERITISVTATVSQDLTPSIKWEEY